VLDPDGTDLPARVTGLAYVDGAASHVAVYGRDDRQYARFVTAP